MKQEKHEAKFLEKGNLENKLIYKGGLFYKAGTDQVLYRMDIQRRKAQFSHKEGTGWKEVGSIETHVNIIGREDVVNIIYEGKKIGTCRYNRHVSDENDWTEVEQIRPWKSKYNVFSHVCSLFHRNDKVLDFTLFVLDKQTYIEVFNWELAEQALLIFWGVTNAHIDMQS